VDLPKTKKLVIFSFNPTKPVSEPLTMNISQAKEIPLDELLARLGFTPAKVVNGEIWYKSPFRANDDTPSFKLSASKKGWYDFGDAETNGGNILDFAIRYFKLGENDISGALRELRPYGATHVAKPSKQATQRAGKRPEQVSKKPVLEKPAKVIIELPAEPTGHTINYVKEFEVWQGYGRGRKFSPLAQYLLDRAITPNVAAPYLANVGFSPAKQPTKKWYGIGWLNQSGGYEVRMANSTGFKACIGTKDITFYAAKDHKPETPHNRLHVFESQFDFLSYLCMFEGINPAQENYLILNSANLAGRAIEGIQAHEQKFEPLILWTQNDEPGQKAAAAFLALTDRAVLTAAHYYEGFKDLNDAFKAQKIKPDVPKAKFNPEFVQAYKSSFSPQ